MALADVLTVALQVAFDSSPNDPPVWTTIASNTTKKLRSWQITRGRDSTLDQFRAGTASFVLDNRDRGFDPLHAGGAFFGKLLPGKRVRLQVTYAGVTYTRFDGFADGWPQEYPSPAVPDALVTLSATDGFKRLSRARLRSAYEMDVRADSPTAWYRLGESSGTVAVDSSGNDIHGTYEGGATFNARSGLVEGDSDGAIAFDGVSQWVQLPATTTPALGGPESFEFIVERGAVTATDMHVVADLGNHYGNTLIGIVGTSHVFDVGRVYGYVNGQEIVSSVRVDDDRRHIVHVKEGAGLDAVVFVDGVNVSTPAGVSYLPAFNQSSRLAGANQAGAVALYDGILDEFSLYADPLSDARIQAHAAAASAPWEGDTPGARMAKVLDAVHWPAADRDIDTGSATLAAALIDDVDALSHLQAVAETEGGRLFIARDGKATLVGRHTFWSATEYTTSQATFSDDGAGLPYTGFGWDWSDNKVRNEVTINPQSGSAQSATDAASVDAHGPVGYSQQSLETDMSKVASQATWLLAKFADPAFEVERLDVDPPAAPPALFPVVLGAELGYRYTVERTPQGVGSQIVQQVHLEGTRESGDSDGYRFSWLLSRAEPAVWILGSSALGSTTVPGY